MRATCCAWAAMLLGVHCCWAQQNDCFRQEVEAHVLEQFSVYGPLSVDHEYFGFVYRSGDRIDSAVTRSNKCRLAQCVVDSSRAAKGIPPRAKVLGEWHTHPHGGSTILSSLDVLGAYRNRSINCYAAFFSAPDGEIVRWNPQMSSVSAAMTSHVVLGNYRRPASPENARWAENGGRVRRRAGPA